MISTTNIAVESTSDRIWRGLGEVADTAKHVASEAATKVAAAYNFAGRKIEQFCIDNLPESVAKVVAAAIWALPYTVAALASSTTISDISCGLSVGLWGIVPREIDETIGKENRQRVYTGIRNAMIIRTGFEVAKMVVTQDWWLLLPIIRHVFLAAQSNSLIDKETPEESFMDKLPKDAEQPKTPDELPKEQSIGVD